MYGPWKSRKSGCRGCPTSSGRTINMSRILSTWMLLAPDQMFMLVHIPTSAVHSSVPPHIPCARLLRCPGSSGAPDPATRIHWVSISSAPDGIVSSDRTPHITRSVRSASPTSIFKYIVFIWNQLFLNIALQVMQGFCTALAAGNWDSSRAGSTACCGCVLRRRSAIRSQPHRQRNHLFNCTHSSSTVLWSV
jgi:hypothetical protein